jgi:23S rRNA (pseudouridine1915-N3)-methyltransferase
LKLTIVARGKIGRCPEADLIVRYVKRMTWPLSITELPDQGGKPPAVDAASLIIALDETGDMWSSTDLARRLEQARDTGVREVRFLIGAADGLSAQEKASATHCLSFGKATWPHMLVRAMLVEQLYRATMIIAGHPYHREG